MALGLFQDFGTQLPPGQPPVDWVEGVAIIIAIVIVVSLKSPQSSPPSDYFIQVVVGSLNDWQKERQFQTLNEKKEERGVKVIRDGIEKIVDIKVRSPDLHVRRFRI